MLEEIQKTDTEQQAAAKLEIFAPAEILTLIIFENYYLITNAAEVKTHRTTRKGTKAELIQGIYG